MSGAEQLSTIVCLSLGLARHRNYEGTKLSRDAVDGMQHAFRGDVVTMSTMMGQSMPSGLGQEKGLRTGGPPAAPGTVRDGGHGELQSPPPPTRSPVKTGDPGTADRARAVRQPRINRHAGERAVTPDKHRWCRPLNIIVLM